MSVQHKVLPTITHTFGTFVILGVVYWQIFRWQQNEEHIMEKIKYLFCLTTDHIWKRYLWAAAACSIFLAQRGKHLPTIIRASWINDWAAKVGILFWNSSFPFPEWINYIVFLYPSLQQHFTAIKFILNAIDTEANLKREIEKGIRCLVWHL